ncbi:MAG: hypothetical protein JSV95_01870 [Gemmatimonadota bacterium]|jgi:hypothetical protein|nr:MAG: hypothetical protein JSV95_01870 [Gemmatimonadota bacterium]
MDGDRHFGGLPRDVLAVALALVVSGSVMAVASLTLAVLFTGWPLSLLGIRM